MMLINFIKPVGDARISSGYGARADPVSGARGVHKGIDFAVPVGTPVRAAAAGVVEYAGSDAVNGNLLRIRHADGRTTHYAHNSRLLVARGANVAQGQIVAHSGATGRVTGAHLHFAIKVNGEFIDPTPILFNGSSVTNEIAANVGQHHAAQPNNVLLVALGLAALFLL